MGINLKDLLAYVKLAGKTDMKDLQGNKVAPSNNYIVNER